MRNLLRSLTLCGLLLVAATATASDDSSWLDLSDYDHSIASGGGQMFVDVLGDIDMMITTQPNTLSTWGSNNIDLMTGDVLDETTCFVVIFSEPVTALVDLQSLDASEVVSLVSLGDLEYTHDLGAVPTVLDSTASSIVLTGNGYAFDDETGAARGLFTLGSTTGFTWCHTSLDELGYEGFSISIAAVPEPTSLGLWAWMATAGLIRLRKRLAA